MKGYQQKLCCESSLEERSAGNLHATFCGGQSYIHIALSTRWRIFKQIRKEDVCVFNGRASDSYHYNHDHVPLGLFKN